MDAATERIATLLAPLTNYERTRPDAVRFSLDPMVALLARAGAPDLSRMRLVQIGGSKGKGTTGAYLETLLGEIGVRTGVYSSPHVTTILERVRIDGEPIREADLVAELTRVLEALPALGLDRASFFEVMTAAGLGCFVAAGVEVGVLEVGLGGRLDATTAVPVDCSVLTGVELEHTEILGTSVAAIAREKAFVVRPSRRAFVALDSPAIEVVRDHAAEVGAELREFGVDFGITPLTPPGSGLAAGERRVRWWSKSSGQQHDLTLSGNAPVYEDQALALAFAVVVELCGERARNVKRLRRPSLPGRFEVRGGPDRPVVLDGAHTPRSAEVIAAALAFRYPGRRFDILFGCAKGKRWRETLKPLLPIADTFAVTALTGTATEDPEPICAWLGQQGATVRAVPDAATWLAELSAESQGALITGSFYLVGEARRSLEAMRDKATE